MPTCGGTGSGRAPVSSSRVPVGESVPGMPDVAQAVKPAANPRSATSQTISPVLATPLAAARDKTRAGLLPAKLDVVREIKAAVPTFAAVATVRVASRVGEM